MAHPETETRRDGLADLRMGEQSTGHLGAAAGRFLLDGLGVVRAERAFGGEPQLSPREGAIGVSDELDLGDPSEKGDEVLDQVKRKDGAAGGPGEDAFLGLTRVHATEAGSRRGWHVFFGRGLDAASARSSGSSPS